MLTVQQLSIVHNKYTFVNMFVGVQFAVRTYICFHANTARVCVRARACKL